MAEITFADGGERRERPTGPAQRQVSVFGEVGAALIALVAIFFLISLFVGQDGQSLIGPVGRDTAAVMNWFFGRFVSFAIPGFLLWYAAQLFFGKKTGWSPVRVMGIFLMILSLCGMIALPLADDPMGATENFARAGAIGTFLVEWEGLRLVGSFGVIGGAMLLIGAAMASMVMMTNIRLSTLAIAGMGAVRRQKAEEGEDDVEAVRHPATLVPTDDLPDKPRPARSKSAKAVHEPEPEPEYAAVGGISGLFRRDKRAALLSEPDPSEVEDIAYGEDRIENFDEDALAAARALEEARIDHEYERALADEEDIIVDDEDEDEILFHDNTATLPILKGNPANNGVDADPALGDGLAKLFPNRWEKNGGDAIRKDPKAKKAAEDAEIRNKAEERAMRLAAGKSSAPIMDDELDGDRNGEDHDPIFDEDLDARPAGVAAAKRAAEVSAVEKAETIMRRNAEMAKYRLPDIQLLEDPPKVDNRMSREEMLEISQTLERTFADFNIAVKVVEVKQGPVVTRFELKPAPGVKVSRIVGLEHDVALAMRAASVRIVAPIPGKAAVGIEIPNKNRAGVYVKELVSCDEFWDHPSPLAFALGKTIEGTPYFADLKKMPHLLIAGATGAGKSVCLNTVICSLLYRQRPDRLRLLMVDPKRVELSIYQNIPHLISPVVCDAKRAAAALSWAVEQMEERYKKLVDFSVRNIDGYNEIASNPEKQAKHRGKNMDIMPHMVIIVDELADLMVVAKAEVEESIQRLAQMSRAVGIHLILATQRPSVNVITGIIKANFPTRIAFQVSQKVDSRTILDCNGAETLLGRGDMLFAPAGAGKPIRVQGAFLSDEEVERIADHCRAMAAPMYDVEEFEPLLTEKEQREMAKLMGPPVDMDELGMFDHAARGTNRTMGKVSAGMFVPHEGGSANAGDDEIDEALVRAAAKVILEGRKGSTSLVQRRLKVGFARAGRLMDMLEEMGIVGPYKGSKPRDLMVDPDAALAQLESLENKIANSGGNSRKAAAVLDGGDDAEEDVFGDDEEEES
ncbi:hypothetical protein BH09SUM1_BH09SUM1_28320 [soil metagenome]